MKKNITLLFFAALLSTAVAQTKNGSFKVLKGEMCVNMIIDYSETDFAGMTESELFDCEKEWAEKKPLVINHCYEYANRILGKWMTLGNYKNSKYTLYLIVHSVDTKGRHNCCLYLYENNENSDRVKLAEREGLNGKGGRVGGYVGLIKDGAESVGTNIGVLLRREVFGHKWVSVDYEF